jgi:peptide/nickel transport system permease protein
MPVISCRSGAGISFGTVVVEKIFDYLDLGTIHSGFNRDEPLIIGIVAFIAITLLLMNLLVDILCVLDPRVRYH